MGGLFPTSRTPTVLEVSSGEIEALSPAKLDAKVYNAGPSLIEALFAGAIDIGYVGPGPILSAFTKSSRRDSHRRRLPPPTEP